MTTNIQRQFYRNGQLREKASLREGKPHGSARTWHRNGVLAAEEHYRDGLLHGVCRQWDANGPLLGEFEMNRGTGLQREWHDNGRLKIEVSTVGGVFCGRNRIWLRDGRLLSERFYLEGKPVTAAEYHAAAKADPTLPRLRGRAGKPLPPGPERNARVYRVFVASLPKPTDWIEARKWLRCDPSDEIGRSLGHFKCATDAARFVEDLYEAGAAEVSVPEIYRDRRGNEFADGLLVRVPKTKATRKAVRVVCARLIRRRLGSVQPETDLGETFLYLGMA